MREILFRAKRRDNGEWVEGLLWKKKYKSNKLFISCFPDEDDYEEVYVVEPETVCQFTGMTDEKGVKIFEGNIVAFTRVNALGWITHRVGEVRYYDELPIFYIMATTGDAWDWVECGNIKVIGNIFDNPELLEGDMSDET